MQQANNRNNKPTKQNKIIRTLKKYITYNF